MDDALDKLTRLDLIARTGMIARGLVYVLLGVLVLKAGDHAAEGQNGAFAALAAVPSGSLMLGAVAVGLLAYALFRIATAAFDIEHNGTSPVGIADRIGHLGVAATYLFFAYSSAEIAIGLRQVDRSYGNRTSRFLAEELLAVPLGSLLLGLVGTGFLVATVLNIRNALRDSHMRFTSPLAPAYVTYVGRAGMFTQAAIAALIGWSLIRAAWFADERQAHAFGGALGQIHRHTFVYDAIAIGLILFGAFSLLLARYRIVPKLDVIDAAKGRVERVRDRLG